MNDPGFDRPTKIFRVKAHLDDFLLLIVQLEDTDNQIYLVIDDDELMMMMALWRLTVISTTILAPAAICFE